MLSIPNSSKSVFSFKLLEKINAANIPSWINLLMKNGDEVSRQYAQERMNELKGLSVSDKYVIRLDETKADRLDKNILSKGDLHMILDNGGDITKIRIQKLSRSTNPDDRHYAAELLLHTSRDESISFLIELLSDNEPKVRNTAIKTSIKKNNQEVINSLIENLGNPVYSNQSMNALVQIGQSTLPLLEAAFYRSGQTTQVMLRIVQTIGRIGGQRSKEMLWGKMDYPDKVVVSQVLFALGECGFKVERDEPRRADLRHVGPEVGKQLDFVRLPVGPGPVEFHPVHADADDAARRRIEPHPVDDGSPLLIVFGSRKEDFHRPFRQRLQRLGDGLDVDDERARRSRHG
jgi:hypothetical protein